jgi:hypothetical protein
MLENVLTAWELTADRHAPEPPASPKALEEAQRTLGRRLPPAALALYAAHGGGSFLGGNLGIHPPVGDGPDDLSLATASKLLRSWDWPIPEELVVFGDNGAGDQFGLWLPAEGGARPLVVQVGEVFGEPGLAVVGDDLVSFLTGWSAYYLLQEERGDTQAALAALGVPEHLRSLAGDGSDEEFHARLRWASPGLTEDPDPYEHGLTPAQVTAIAGRAT